VKDRYFVIEQKNSNLTLIYQVTRKKETTTFSAGSFSIKISQTKLVVKFPDWLDEIIP